MKIAVQEEIEHLRKISLFRNLKLSELKLISMTVDNFIYEAGEVIVKEGDEGNEAYVIYSGAVEVYRTQADGEAISLNLLGPGKIFGEMALFGDGYRTASVKATEETLVGVIAREKLYEVIREFPEIAIEMLKVQTERFAVMEGRLMRLLRKGG